MILKRLMEWAENCAELPPSGFQPRFITKVIRLKRDGSFVDLIPLSAQTRGRRSGEMMYVPQESPRRTTQVCARLIADNAYYVLGVVGAKPANRVATCHERYCGLIEECYHATREPAVLSIKKWLDAGGPAKLRARQDIAEDDEFTIEVDGIRPTDLASVRAFWVSRGDSHRHGTCLVMGTAGPVVDRMPAPIKGVPGGQASGTALISVNNPSGESYGLEAALNSPISPYAAEGIGNALNALLASSAHSLRVGKGVYVYWTRSKEEFSWDILNNPRPEDVERLLTAPRRGAMSEGVEPKDFFVLSLSANVSRIVVRDYHETTLENVKENLRKWFDRLTLVSPDGTGAKPVGIFRISESLFLNKKDIPAGVPTALLSAAIAGRPLPSFLLTLAVKRNLAMQGPFSVNNGKKWTSYERLALIKALLSDTSEVEQLNELNENHSDSAYHCGRLLAVLERIQRAALGKINATIVDRYYGAACANPGSILGNLVNDAQSHLGKLRKENKDYHHQLRLEQVLAAIGDRFPKTLNLQRQGLFALGYYHQKAADRAAAKKYKELQVEGEEA